MSDHVVWVTGAAGGIGLELCRQSLERGATVVASPRRESAELARLEAEAEGRLHVILMDVADDDSVASAAAEASRHLTHLDVLFNNAGVYPEKRGPLAAIDLADCAFAYEVNALGPLRVTRALLPMLRKGSGKRLVHVTSLMGSMADNSSGGSYAYRMSKAALNMANVNLAHELGGEGFVSVAVHPGWVQTRMGGGAAPLDPTTSVAGILELTDALDASRSGRFFRWDGAELAY